MDCHNQKRKQQDKLSFNFYPLCFKSMSVPLQIWILFRHVTKSKVLIDGSRQQIGKLVGKIAPIHYGGICQGCFLLPFK